MYHLKQNTKNLSYLISDTVIVAEESLLSIKHSRVLATFRKVDIANGFDRINKYSPEKS